jgi:protein-L-isoaspartate(D-aspartate) O-methyltransferase
MVERLRSAGITSGSLLKAMETVPRHLFLSEALRYRAYDEVSVPIGHGQTLSRPSTIAIMVQALNLTGEERVLEVGTGSGYQTALLGLLAGRVTSLECIRELSMRARTLLLRMGYGNCTLVHSDDFSSVEGEFDAVVVSAGANIFPSELYDKLLPGGRLVIPLFRDGTHVITRHVKLRSGEIMTEELGEATFVPLMRAGSPL